MIKIIRAIKSKPHWLVALVLFCLFAVEMSVWRY